MNQRSVVLFRVNAILTSLVGTKQSRISIRLLRTRNDEAKKTIANAHKSFREKLPCCGIYTDICVDIDVVFIYGIKTNGKLTVKSFLFFKDYL